MAGRALTILLLAVLAVAVNGCAYSGEPTHERSRRGLGVNNAEPNCDPNAKYRSYDGSCNNIYDGKIGRAGREYMRALPPAYDKNDGKTPRLTAKSGNPLPSGRSISHVAHDDTGVTHDTSLQVITAAWGQFIAHDINYTPWNTVKGGCCSNDLVTENKQHADVNNGGDCFPILIDEGDITWKSTQDRCMEFFRSDSTTDQNGVRQQYNQASAFIDGSQIYGLNEDIAKGLRANKDGKLKSKIINGEEFLPELTDTDESFCYKVDDGDYCFAAGDDRANLHPGLMAMQTIFLRYHNQIAEQLKARHGSWDDETLYQEARRIVIAVTQVITYNEYLSKIVGINAYPDYALKSNRNFAYTYKPHLSADIMNVFSAAAYRFGHSMIPDSFNISGNIVETGDMFMRPKYVLKDFTGLVQGMIDGPIDRIDRWYTKQMTERLFQAPNHQAYDIVARNIQRGRDHGLPSFNDYLVRFNFSRMNSFEDMDMDRANVVYPKVYEDIDDVDVYSGGLSYVDTSRSSGLLFRNIIAEQFYYLKWADRFWYENTDTSTGKAKLFTTRQVRSLGKMTLARVICDTIPGITEIPSDVMEQINENKKNTVVSCDSLKNIDIKREF